MSYCPLWHLKKSFKGAFIEQMAITRFAVDGYFTRTLFLLPSLNDRKHIFRAPLPVRRLYAGSCRPATG
uniref:Uncharacterized protein n=1 Tax=Escherichia coli O81 (strain ED1a) TaxID=585397 RepID=B7LIT4_ECO81|nr:hypothetical protein pECED1a_0136 [Escherichia coli ED1a]